MVRRPPLATVGCTRARRQRCSPSPCPRQTRKPSGSQQRTRRMPPSRSHVPPAPCTRKEAASERGAGSERGRQGPTKGKILIGTPMGTPTLWAYLRTRPASGLESSTSFWLLRYNRGSTGTLSACDGRGVSLRHKLHHPPYLLQFRHRSSADNEREQCEAQGERDVAEEGEEDHFEGEEGEGSWFVIKFASDSAGRNRTVRREDWEKPDFSRIF